MSLRGRTSRTCSRSYRSENSLKIGTGAKSGSRGIRDCTINEALLDHSFTININSMNARDINTNKLILETLIGRAIKFSVATIVGECKKLTRKPHEPDFIASLTLNFVPLYYGILKAVFPQAKFSVTGIYCHQRPIVDINESNSPELGDILFVYIYTDRKGKTKRNSLLLQAKMSQKESHYVPSTEMHQLKLYMEWPDFSYKKAGALTGVSRSVQPKAIHDGAQYLLIDDHPVTGLAGSVGTFPMGCAIPDRTLQLNDDLTNELLEFMKFKAGRSFEEDKNRTKDDWTQVVWDLLDLAQGKATRRMNAGYTSFPRGVSSQDDGWISYRSDGGSIFDRLHEMHDSNMIQDYKSSFGDEENPAVSVLLIEAVEGFEEG